MKIKKAFFALIAVMAIAFAFMFTLGFKPAYAEETNGTETEEFGQTKKHFRKRKCFKWCRG